MCPPLRLSGDLSLTRSGADSLQKTWLRIADELKGACGADMPSPPLYPPSSANTTHEGLPTGV